MVFPANGLRGLISNVDLSEFGKNPSRTTAEPLWRCTQITPTVATVQSIIDAADLYDMVLLVNFAGARGSWTNIDPNNGNTIYDPAKYEANVRKYEGNANVLDAITRRRFINFTVDEPQIASFGGSISKIQANEMGLLHRTVFPGCLTAMRTPSTYMIPPPAGGWTGVDYGWAQFNRAAANSPLTPRQWFDNERAQLATVFVGMVPAHNWLDGGDGRNWDFLNTGSSVGRILGQTGTPKWLASPAEIRERADAIFDDPQAFGHVGYAWCTSSFAADYQQYQNRSDFVAAFNYALNKLASRTVFTGFRTPKGSVVIPPGTGAEIDHFASTPVTTRVSTTSSTYVDVPGAVIAASDLTVGKQYFIVATGSFDLATATAEGFVRLVNGTTLVNRSESGFTTNQANAHFPYSYVGVITAVSGQDVTLQYRNSDNVTAIGGNLIQLSAINISDALTTGTDVKWAESTALTTLTGAFQDGASITFTPATAAQDWLVFSSAHYQTPSVTASVVSGLRRSGEDVGTDPEVQMEGEDSAQDKYRLTVAKVLTLGANSNTFAEQSKNTGSGGPRDGSFVFALRLNAFAAHGFAYDNSDLPLGTTAFGTLLGSTGLTSTVDGDIWALGSFGWTPNSLISGFARLRQNGSDAPTGQSTTNSRYSLAFDATDVAPTILSSITPTTAGSQTTTIEGSAASGAVAVARGRLSMLVTMALAASAAGTTKVRNSRSGIGTRAGTRKVL